MKGRQAAPVSREGWIEVQLEKAGPLTQEQQAQLRRVLLPPKPVTRTAAS